MSLSVPISTVEKDGYDLILYANPPYGYYIKKFTYKTKLLTSVVPCIKDYEKAVAKFDELVNQDDTLREIVGDLERCEKYINQATGKKDLKLVLDVLQNVKRKIQKL